MAKKKHRALQIALITILVVLVCALGGGIWFISHISNPENAFSELRESGEVTLAATATVPPTLEPTKEADGEPTATPALTPTPEPEMTPPDYQFEKKRINILLLGADSSIERVEAGLNFRTDTMILVTVDFDNKAVDMISIPRDSYMRINKGTRFNKINAAFVFGGGADKDGYAYSMNTVSDLLGVKIDYYVGFGMNVVKDVVNAMGGVDYDVDIAFTMCGRPTEKGMQHMDGQKVLDYCRFRKGGRGDVDRVERQQKMLFTIFETMLNTNQVKNIPQIYTAVQENIDTNLDVMQIATLAYFAKDLSMDQIQRHTIPGNGQYVGSTSYYIINQQKKNKLVQEVFGIDGPFDEAITLEAIQARVAEQEGTVPGEGEDAPEGGADDEADQEKLLTLTMEAGDMLDYMDAYADLSDAEVAVAYARLKDAMANQNASEMRSAMSKVRALLPDA